MANNIIATADLRARHVTLPSVLWLADAYLRDFLLFCCTALFLFLLSFVFVREPAHGNLTAVVV